MTDSDDALLTRLDRLLADADPVPDAVLAAARASLGWRALDAELDVELARLVADSLVSSGDVRGAAARLLSFEAGELTLEVEVSPVGTRLRIVGQVVPPRPASVRAEQPGGTGIRVAADELGRFTIGDLPAGPTRFVCAPAEGDGAPVCTEWTLL